MFISDASLLTGGLRRSLEACGSSGLRIQASAAAEFREQIIGEGLDATSVATASESTFEVGKVYGDDYSKCIYMKDYDGRYFPLRSNETEIVYPPCTIPLGDVAFAKIGQIVNRDLYPLLGRQRGIVYVRSIAKDVAVLPVALAEWNCLGSDGIADHLKSDVDTPNLHGRFAGAILAHLVFFPGLLDHLVEKLDSMSVFSLRTANRVAEYLMSSNLSLLSEKDLDALCDQSSIPPFALHQACLRIKNARRGLVEDTVLDSILDIVERLVGREPFLFDDDVYDSLNALSTLSASMSLDRALSRTKSSLVTVLKAKARAKAT